MEFDITVRRKDGEYFLWVRELGVAVRGPDLEKAMAELEAKAKVADEVLAAGGFSAPPSGGGEPSLPLIASLRPFLVKTAVLSALAAGFLMWASIPLANAVAGLNAAITSVAERAAATLGGVASPQGASRAAADLFIKVGDTVENLTPERKEQLRVSARKIVRELKPLVDEFEPIAGKAPATCQR